MPSKKTANQEPVVEIEQHIRLTYTEPPSNKEYQVALVREGKAGASTLRLGASALRSKPVRKHRRQ